MNGISDSEWIRVIVSELRDDRSEIGIRSNVYESDRRSDSYTLDLIRRDSTQHSDGNAARDAQCHDY